MDQILSFFDIFKQKSFILTKIESDAWLGQLKTCLQKRRFFLNVSDPWIFMVKQWFMTLINRSERQQTTKQSFGKNPLIWFQNHQKTVFWHYVNQCKILLFSDSEAKCNNYPFCLVVCSRSVRLIWVMIYCCTMKTQAGDTFLKNNCVTFVSTFLIERANRHFRFF